MEREIEIGDEVRLNSQPLSVEEIRGSLVVLKFYYYLDAPAIEIEMEALKLLLK